MSEPRFPNSLRHINRFITEHNVKGQATFNRDIAEVVLPQTIPTGDKMYLGYATNQLPTDLTKDLVAYQQYLTNAPGFTIPGGTVMSIIDMAPGSISPLHRTRSLDYCVVIEGCVELELDSGEVRELRNGDIAVQRGTMHRWKNTSKTEWARVLFVLQDSKPVEVAGQTLKEDYGFGPEGLPDMSA